MGARPDDFSRLTWLTPKLLRSGSSARRCRMNWGRCATSTGNASSMPRARSDAAAQCARISCRLCEHPVPHSGRGVRPRAVGAFGSCHRALSRRDHAHRSGRDGVPASRQPFPLEILAFWEDDAGSSANEGWLHAFYRRSGDPRMRRSAAGEARRGAGGELLHHASRAVATSWWQDGRL